MLLTERSVTKQKKKNHTQFHQSLRDPVNASVFICPPLFRLHMLLNWNPIVYCEWFLRPLNLHMAPGPAASFPDACSQKDLSDHRPAEFRSLRGQHVPSPAASPRSRTARKVLPREPRRAFSGAWAAAGRSALRAPGPHSRRCQSPPSHPTPPHPLTRRRSNSGDPGSPCAPLFPRQLGRRVAFPPAPAAGGDPRGARERRHRPRRVPSPPRSRAEARGAAPSPSDDALPALPALAGRELALALGSCSAPGASGGGWG